MVSVLPASNRSEALKQLDRQLREGLATPEQGISWQNNLYAVVTDYDVASHLCYALNTGFPEFTAEWPENDRIVSICGSAPSLNDTWKDIRGDVWACNDAGWKLLDLGIVPKFHMVWDPQPLVTDCLRKLHKDVTYLVCSMCHPSVFDKLKGYNVLIWHPWMGDALPYEEWMRGAEAKSSLTIGFGLNIPAMKLKPGEVASTSAAVTRSMQFAPLLGYRHLHIHGCDSSSANGVVHFEDLEVDKDQLQKVCWVGLKSMPGSKRQFVTTPQMERQILEFEPLVCALRDEGVKVTVYGYGAIPWLAMLKGWHVNNIPPGHN